MMLQERKSLRFTTPLDKILENRRMTNELFKYYKGTVEQCILCIDPFTQVEEYQDINNIMDLTPNIKLIPGMEVIIENNNGMKGAVFKRFLSGIFHKWEMLSGKYLILSQTEVDRLGKKEKRDLRMNL